ncbi:hypothetical protein SAMN05216252_112127 [Actinacidiphila glaucinigra]|uniref:Uncharacterized protein n=1 Tax=Actinacidiphila glaucinigra TaxID=235986 RepID=A0A239J7W3_9ACTN|nr:hypothetical protein SAMN05216252_112127 [Actinacidiphila glaucinigra]
MRGQLQALLAVGLLRNVSVQVLRRSAVRRCSWRRGSANTPPMQSARETSALYGDDHGGNRVERPDGVPPRRGTGRGAPLRTVRRVPPVRHDAVSASAASGSAPVRATPAYQRALDFGMRSWVS